MAFIISLLRFARLLRAGAGKAVRLAGRAAAAAAGFARRLVIYCCLAAAIVIDRILDRLEDAHE